MTSNARNQARWRDRAAIKVRYFHDMDERRAAGIRSTLDLGEGPEADRIREYLLNHPACFTGILSFGLEPNAQWCVSFDGADENARMCAVVALAALRSISSLPCFGQAVGGGEGVASNDALIFAVEHTVKEMKDLGMWGLHE